MSTFKRVGSYNILKYLNSCNPPGVTNRRGAPRGACVVGKGEYRIMKALGILMFFVLICSEAEARDAFDAIKCGIDIPKTLIGKTMMDGKIVAIEGRHKNIGLVDLGADEISDRLQMVSWRICGSDYNILVDGNDIIHDVLPFPDHSRSTPEFGGICHIDGKDAPQSIVALLDNKTGFDANIEHHYSPGDGTYLSALAAWGIDEKRAKFVKIPVEGLRCPRSGINSVDGGP
jgi:hypothetical protein